MKSQKPQENWINYKIVKMYGDFATYAEALNEEKIACATSDSDIQDCVDRGPGKRKVKPPKNAVSPPPKLDEDNSFLSELSDKISSDHLITSTPELQHFDLDSQLEVLEIPQNAVASGTEANIQADINLNTNADFEVVDVEICNKTLDIKLDIITQKIQEMQSTLSLILVRLSTLEEENANQNVNANLDFKDILCYLPCGSIEQLLEFEEKLKNPAVSKQLLMKFIQHGGKDTSSFIRRGLALTFTNSLGIMCSWTGQKQNFRVQDLGIIKVLRDATKQLFHSCTDCAFENMCKEWFRHSRTREKREADNK